MQSRIQDLISFGLQKKYSGPAGPIQEVEISFSTKDDIRIEKITRDKRRFIVDFVADLKETKIIYYDIETSVISFSFFYQIKGTLFYINNEFEDLILEF